jgi:hypothetical protein
MTIKNYIAAADVAAHSIVRFGSADFEVVPATSGTDMAIGITDCLDTKAGGIVDIYLSGICDVRFGGNVERGAAVTSNAQGLAVAAQTSDKVIGYALQSAVANDIGSIVIDRR